MLINGHLVIAQQFVDRGDPSAYDFEPEDFTDDYQWHDLDLSSIVDRNAKCVVLTILMKSPTVDAEITLRKNGNTNERNYSRQYIQAANQAIVAQLIVSPDNNGVIEYKVSNVVWTCLHVCIVGWFV